MNPTPIQAVIVALLLVATSAAAEPTGRDVGRYQVLTATVQWPARAHGDSTQLPTAMKIDTVTGQTWILSPITRDNICPVAWIEIPTWVPEPEKPDLSDPFNLGHTVPKK